MERQQGACASKLCATLVSLLPAQDTANTAFSSTVRAVALLHIWETTDLTQRRPKLPRQRASTTSMHASFQLMLAPPFQSTMGPRGVGAHSMMGNKHL